MAATGAGGIGEGGEGGVGAGAGAGAAIGESPAVKTIDAPSPAPIPVEQVHDASATAANGAHGQVESTKQHQQTSAEIPITLRLPHKYTTTIPATPSASSSAATTTTTATTPFTAPPLEWLQRTWTVTHSTLPMWRSAKNVRITYKIIEPASGSGGGQRCLDDTVTSVPTKRTLLPQPRSIRGVDTPVLEGRQEAGWNWRGKGWLKITSSHWEVLGWGEREMERDGEGREEEEEERGRKGGSREREWERTREKERWVVTWFAPSLFTPAGVDVYSDRKGGISKGLFRDVERALEGLEGGGDLAGLCKREMREILIDDAEEDE